MMRSREPIDVGDSVSAIRKKIHLGFFFAPSSLGGGARAPVVRNKPQRFKIAIAALSPLSIFWASGPVVDQQYSRLAVLALPQRKKSLFLLITGKIVDRLLCCPFWPPAAALVFFMQYADAHF
jgi:hypothetical protein